MYDGGNIKYETKMYDGVIYMLLLFFYATTSLLCRGPWCGFEEGLQLFLGLIKYRSNMTSTRFHKTNIMPTPGH